MADIMATISNIGIVPCIGAIVIVGLLIAAFAFGGNKGDKGGSNGSSNNQKTDGGSK